MSNRTERLEKYLRVRAQLDLMIADGKRDEEVVAGQLQAIITGQNAPRPAVPGTEIVLGLGECIEFMIQFCGIRNTSLAPQIPLKPNGFFWPVPCHQGLTYPNLADLIVARGIPHCDWVPDFLRKQVDHGFDCRKAEDGNYLLWTPAGIESRQACPELRGKSYRDLGKMKNQILTCREEVILWLLIYWKTDGKVRLDSEGWARTGSRDVRGRGVILNSPYSKLNISWGSAENPDPSGSARSVISV